MISPEVVRGARLELARRSLWWYCMLKAPDFYKEDRAFLQDLCNQLQDFIESDEPVCIVNMPPRFGKSRTGGKMTEWLLGRDHNVKIMTGSYNEGLSTVFAKGVRDTIMEEKLDEERIVFTDIFPNTRIKRGDGSMSRWSLEDGYNNYLATSPNGSATGFGANIIIIDDLIKSKEEAYNANVLEKHWEWFTGTMLSRLEGGLLGGGKIIVIMTRWHTQDLAGRLLNFCTNENIPVRLILYKAELEDGSMLCPEILSKASFDATAKAQGLDIVSANYQQEPIDLKGRLYSAFKTYDDIPRDGSGQPLFTKIKNYTDTADTGDDFLCSIDYGVYNNEAYVLDLIYTKEPMELTEPAVAAMLMRDGVNIADIESNNGGRGFARQIKRLMAERGSNKCRVNAFYQSMNKQSRILSNATWVMDHIYFPVNWMDRFPEYAEAMRKYQKEGKNEHDDAPDATTGIAERLNTEPGISFD